MTLPRHGCTGARGSRIAIAQPIGVIASAARPRIGVARIRAPERSVGSVATFCNGSPSAQNGHFAPRRTGSLTPPPIAPIAPAALARVLRRRGERWERSVLHSHQDCTRHMPHRGRSAPRRGDLVRPITANPCQIRLTTGLPNDPVILWPLDSCARWPHSSLKMSCGVTRQLSTRRPERHRGERLAASHIFYSAASHPAPNTPPV